MFQEYALFPHKDVFDNVAFGLRMEDREPEAVRSRVAEILKVVGLTGFEHRDVNQLSGGERQRVALARSLAPEPRLLMLDEPLGALDRTLRERLLEELPSILKRVGVTTITVTHDQEEAFAIADRVALMRAGRVVQQGTPEQVYCKPASLWAARFLGLTNLLTASVVSESIVETPLGRLRVDNLKEEPPGTGGTLLVRPEAARLEEGGQLNRITAQLTSQTFRGSRYQFGLRLKTGIEFEFERPSGREMPAIGEQVTLWLDPEGLVFLRE
jgi:ABC-type Fe3+/spermidine/putrescine transport system ATPase subunit